jgi:uncharacterized Zn ribbon protein
MITFCPNCKSDNVWGLVGFPENLSCDDCGHHWTGQEQQPRPESEIAINKDIELVDSFMNHYLDNGLTPNNWGLAWNRLKVLLKNHTHESGKGEKCPKCKSGVIYTSDDHTQKSCCHCNHTWTIDNQPSAEESCNQK